MKITDEIKQIEVVDPIIVGTHNNEDMKDTQEKEPTIEELEAMLAKKKAAERRKREKERKDYEERRENTVVKLHKEAVQVNELLGLLKESCHDLMEKQAQDLNGYGEMPGNSKGGFTIKSKDGSIAVTRRRDTQPRWDERSIKGASLIREFLGDTVKKRDKDTYEMLMSFLARNENGDMEYSRVMVLLQHRDRFEDNRWLEGLRLINESYSTHMKAYAYVFKVRGAGDKWETLELNFSAI
ncbi:DUF3164 family protein [Spongiimicrobium salis]|uniref:DUF3164 family protein n=1 Tax=Spongiimicrobium salis TaxID=1667022 RepID=UPI00374CB404